MKRIFIFFAIALLISCQKENSSTATTDTVLKFNMGSNTYQFSSDSTTAKESMVNGSDRIEIVGRKVVDEAGTIATVRMLIVGNPQVYPGTYTAPTWFSLQDGDVVTADKDFSLQVSSYQNGYLNASFNSSRFSNGMINHLKITQ